MLTEMSCQRISFGAELIKEMKILVVYTTFISEITIEVRTNYKLVLYCTFKYCGPLILLCPKI